MNVLPAMETTPLRAVAAVFSAMDRPTEPEPDPLEPAVTAIQGTLEDAAQVQSVPADTLTETFVAAGPIDIPVLDRVVVQVFPA